MTESIGETVSQDVTSSFESVLSELGVNFGNFAITNLISAAIILVVALILIKVIVHIAEKTMEHSKMDPLLKKPLITILKIVLYAITAIVVIGALGVNTSSLIALFSVVGLAVSLAAQNTLSNVAGGIMLLANKPFSKGDYVAVGTFEGTVREVALNYTKIVTLDNKLVSIPNSTISADEIVNYSVEGRRRVDLKFSADYADSCETVKKALKEAADSVPQVLKDPAPVIRVCSYGSSSIEYTTYVWCRTEDYWDTFYGVTEAVDAAFRRNGITMSYDHLNVHMIPPEPAAES